jgi:hypothetical protein
LSSESLSSTFSSLLEWTSTMLCVFVWFFFLRFFHIVGHFLFIIFYFHL